MTYFGFLFRFLGPPLVILSFLTWWDHKRGKRLPDHFNNWPMWVAIVAHIVVAVIYTTPWDNYLVATRVWWYDPELVSGIILGWVPLEEYIFFVLQTWMTGLWLFWLARNMRLPETSFDPTTAANKRIRIWSTVVFLLIFVASAVLLFSGWRPGRYMGLMMTWATLPMVLQMAFGGDILWHYRKLVLFALIPPWIYLSAADYLAIGLGTWIIAPDQSMGIGINHLPLEEIMFFLVTNMLVVFGVTLVMARASLERAPKSVLRLMHRVSGTSATAHSMGAAD
jgi:lycopene cyclase domain-containing protein